MTRPQRKDVASLTLYDEERFGRWLHTGFNAYYLEGKGRMAFMPLQSFIGLEPDLVEDIANLYQLLEITEQAAFRAGLAIALARTEFHLEKIPVLEALLSLGSTIGAWEILPVITDKQRINWISRDLPDDDLFDVSLRTIVSLAVNAGPTAQTTSATNALLEFARSRAFPQDYAEPVLVALCRLRPQQAWSNVVALRNALYPMLRRAEDDAEEDARATTRQRLVSAMYSVLGQKNFVKAMKAAASGGANSDRDWWLATAISVGEPQIWDGAKAARAPASSGPIYLTANEDRIPAKALPRNPLPVSASGLEKVYRRLFPSGGGLAMQTAAGGIFGA